MCRVTQPAESQGSLALPRHVPGELQVQAFAAYVLQVHLEKSALFHPNQALSCLSLLHVRGLPESPPGQNRLHTLNTLVDLTGTEQVDCPIILDLGLTGRQLSDWHHASVQFS